MPLLKYGYWATKELGHLDIARLLLEARADMDAADMIGWTPLVRAAAGGHWDVTQLLLEAYIPFGNYF